MLKENNRILQADNFLGERAGDTVVYSLKHGRQPLVLDRDNSAKNCAAGLLEMQCPEVVALCALIMKFEKDVLSAHGQRI